MSKVVNDSNIKEALRAKGVKVTNQRIIVLGTIASKPGEHYTAEEIYLIVKKKNPEIGLATVYRTIQLLVELGLVDKVNLNDGYARYEIATNATESGHHHHHLICIKCGKIFSFEDDLLENLEDDIRQKMGFEVLNHEVKLYGLCKACRNL